jgi:hypothetical protein
MMQLREIVGKYLALVGSFGQPAPLAGFGLGREETERVFSIFDEDYHISRFFHFSNLSGGTYQVNGFPHTHVSLDAEIQSIL